MGILPLAHLLLLFLHLLCCFFFLLLVPQTRAALLRERHICQDSQKSALLQLQQQSFNSSNLWETKTDCCSWGGITCNITTGYVIGLDLGFKELSGTFPDSIGNLRYLMTLRLSNCNLSGSVSSSSLKNLTQLTELDLSENAFTVSFPSSIANLTHLAILDLSSNSFTGSIPSALANLTHLTLLDLSFNSFTGSIPLFNKDNAPNLDTLSLSNNILDGIIHSSISTLTSLKTLHLSQNQLRGQLELFHNSSISSLEYLDLSGNKLNGQIPKLSNLFSSLEFLYLNSNNFNGTLNLDMLGNLVNLCTLDLSNNQLSLEAGNNSSNLPKLIEVLLSSCHLTEFPNFLKTRKMLWKLDLSNNNISGKLPNWIWKKHLYHLNLSYNSLNVLEPPLINFYSSPLRFLDLGSNNIQGSLPIPSPSNTFYSISNNSFIGGIPESICKLTNLEFFDASYNNLSGSIPECLGNIDTLSVLDVQRNRFHRMPQSFSNASRLRTLRINGNILDGGLPRSLANCKSLEVLDLGKNKIFGTFPFWLGKLPILRVLVLHSNRFYGSIEHPRTFHNEFPMLQIMDLSSNRFTGYLPAEYFQSFRAMKLKDGNKSKAEYIGHSFYSDSVTIMNKGLEMQLVRILTIFTALDLSNNRFRGEIPQVIGELTSLVVLNLSHNDLTGQIPSLIGNMVELESLDLSQNKLSGQIPWQLTNLTFLAFLNLSQNHLEGPIPRGNQLETFSSTTYSENPGLCGFPLSRKCRDASDEMPPQGGKFKQSTNDVNFDWKFMLMGYGSGMVIGIVIGYVILKDEWLIMIFRLAPIGRQRNPKRGRLRRR